MRQRFIQHPDTGELIPADRYERDSDAHHIIEDIKPYQSMITGEWITSRSQHREHLRLHGCQEIGNETKYLQPRPLPDVSPQKRRELIRAQIDAMSHKEFKSAIKRDVDRVKWSSRER